MSRERTRTRAARPSGRPAVVALAARRLADAPGDPAAAAEVLDIFRTALAARAALLRGAFEILSGAVPEPAGPALTFETQNILQLRFVRAAGHPAFTTRERRLGRFLHDLLVPHALLVRAHAPAAREQDGPGLERRLAEAERRLSEYRQAGLKGELAFQLVRELTDPIAGLLGLAEHLRASTGDGPQRGLFEVLEAQALRVRHILEQFSAIVRREGPAERHESITLAKILWEVFESMVPRFRARNVLQTTGLPDETIRVKAPAGLLARLLTNLVQACLNLAAPERGAVSMHASGSCGSARIELSVRNPRVETGGLPRRLAGLDPRIWNHPPLLDLAVLAPAAEEVGGALEVLASKDGLLVRLDLPLEHEFVPLQESGVSPIP